MKKRLISILVLFLLVFSMLTLAQEEIQQDSCSGFFGKIKCFFFGDPDQRAVAGQGWFDRDEALVGR